MKKTIAVDFDGTLCENKWPKIGEANTALIAQLAAEQQAGAVIILWTCREGKMLKEAVKWLKEKGLKCDYVNRNSAERIAAYKNDCRKIGADIYIDDRAAAFRFGEKIKIGEGEEDAG